MDEIVLRDSWRDRLDEIAGDRKKVIMWAIAVCVVLLVGVGYIRANAPQPVIAPPSTVPAVDSSASPTRAVFVHVAGAVRRPGLYRIPSGTRVADAIEAAGGPLARGDLDALNLADLVTDGMKIDIPVRGRAPVAVAASATPPVIDLNSADVTVLETIPGIGPVTAAAIVQHRTEIGAFDSIEQLLDVTGIGPATLESLRPYVTV